MADKAFKITSKVITVAGRRLTVYKSTFEAVLKRFTLMEEAEKSLSGDGDQEEGIAALLRRGFHVRTYPSLVACTTGNLWTEDECYKIENDDLQLWLITAREMNPDWFPSAAPETPAEANEKKTTPD